MRFALEPRKEFCLLFDLHVDRVDEVDRGTLARVDGAPEHREANHLCGGNFQPLEHRGLDCVFGMVERELYFGQSEHGA